MRSRSVDRVAATVLLAVSLCVTACEVRLPGWVPDPWADATRGAATGHAIEVGAHATAISRSLASAVLPSCRHESPHGHNAVRTRIEYVREAEFVAPQRLIEERWWVRDGEGDLLASRQLAWSLPDQRPVTRLYESRVVAGRNYRALDDRFVEMDRVDDFADLVAAEGHAAVDQLLSVVAEVGGRWVAAPTRSGGLCRVMDAAQMGAPTRAEGRIEAGRRAGTITWQDRRGAVTVTFDEVTERSDLDVRAPEELWPVDPEPGFAEVSAVVAEGIAGGWIVAEEGSAPVSP